MAYVFHTSFDWIGWTHITVKRDVTCPLPRCRPAHPRVCAARVKMLLLVGLRDQTNTAKSYLLFVVSSWFLSVCGKTGHVLTCFLSDQLHSIVSWMWCWLCSHLSQLTKFQTLTILKKKRDQFKLKVLILLSWWNMVYMFWVERD